MRSGPERRARPRGGALQPLWRALYGLLRFIGTHVRGFHAAVGTFLGLGLAVALLGVAAFAGLAELVEEGMTQRFDERVLLWMNAHASPKLDVLALEVTALGSGMVVWMTLLVASVFLWLSGHRYSVALLWIAFLGSTLLNSALKAGFDRPRPDLFEWRVVHAGQSSFPSGHTMTGTVVYATLAYLVTRLEPSRRLRRFTMLVALVVVVMVGASRLYLGVHYPSDVLAGFVAGLAWATCCALGIEALRYFRARRPQAARQEEDLERGMDRVRDAVEESGDGR
jgi:undecaprenyl-diphosphatase